MRELRLQKMTNNTTQQTTLTSSEYLERAVLIL